ncbi:hypothetical protein HDU96_002573 [Phlyctochytrium bullatum]|nr:hypothetical protein HDU96_002573 [Phlyctochytrium bullatum]
MDQQFWRIASTGFVDIFRRLLNGTYMNDEAGPVDVTFLEDAEKPQHDTDWNSVLQ